MKRIKQLWYEIRVFGWRNPVRRFLNRCIDRLGRAGDFTPPNPDDNTSYYVAGAGSVHLSHSTSIRTESTTGFAFGVSWGKHGYAGGVLDKREAWRMADFILRSIGRNAQTGSTDNTDSFGRPLTCSKCSGRTNGLVLSTTVKGNDLLILTERVSQRRGHNL